ncbi:hypothetical protein FHS89_000927 [Rubricella aquisinus]|uniref:STAS/SEC14 domain-containing protein n=1 Tax=Rubricella aquisinus TaxID=2028108 RepID=A0A840WK69_9RHOB|nr:STAS/SEC14 domain-containing protein [Rubricella aquisinus]MBB5514921.1 hypothetical protein [Rubricella aquisinus]
MLTTTRVSDNRVDLVLDGPLDGPAMAAVLDDLLDKTDGMAHGQALYTITDFQWPTGGALLVELAYMPRLFALIHRIDRCAVLCDTDWIKRAAEIEGAMIPGITIKTFALNEAEAAEMWLTA